MADDWFDRRWIDCKRVARRESDQATNRRGRLRWSSFHGGPRDGQKFFAEFLVLPNGQRLAVIYDRAMDCYVVELRDGSNIICQKETIFVDELAQTIENLIDDGKWRDIKIEVLKPARSTQVAA